MFPSDWKFTLTRVDEEKLKKRFAEQLLRKPHDAYKIAVDIAEGDYAKAHMWSQRWPHDEEVLNHQKCLIEKHGEDYFLPTKSDYVHKLWKEIDSKYESGANKMEHRDMINALRLAAEMSQHVGDNVPKAPINNEIRIIFVKSDKEQTVTTIENEPADSPIPANLPNIKFIK